MLNKIRESAGVDLYQKLLKTLGGYSVDIPATGVDSLFNAVAEYGKKVMPKNKKALEILKWLLTDAAPAQVVHKLLNLRFSDLPVSHRPISKAGRKHQVAHWTRDGKISDRIKDLISWDGSGKAGNWTDVDGEKVTLIPIEKKEDS